MTLNSLLKIFEKFAKDHKQINDYGQGVLANADFKSINYPLMWVTHQTATFSRGQVLKPVVVALFDLVKHDGSNTIDVQSDMEEIGKDLIASLSWVDIEELDEIDSVTMDYIEDKLGDEVAGIELTINLKTDYVKDRCVIPLKYE